MLVDTKGKIISKIEKFTPFNVPVTEDMKELKDGRLVWSYVDNVTKVVSLAYLPAPTGDSNKYINLIETQNNNALISTTTTTITSSNSALSWINLNMIIAFLLLII